MYAADELLDCVEVMGARAYLVAWSGYPLACASWEVEEHCTPDLIDEYNKRYASSATTRLAPSRSTFRQHEFDLETSYAQERDMEAIECNTFKWADPSKQILVTRS